MTEKKKTTAAQYDLQMLERASLTGGQITHGDGLQTQEKKERLARRERLYMSCLELAPALRGAADSEFWPQLARDLATEAEASLDEFLGELDE